MLQDLSGETIILLASDDVVLRNFVATVLQREGYTVFAAARGSEALEIASTYRKPIHLLATDFRVGRTTGMEIYERMAEEHPSVKALFVSRRAPVEQHHLLDELPVLIGPFDADALRQKVREIVYGDTKDQELPKR
jgi:DNA-binding response OmpR family regulator